MENKNVPQAKFTVIPAGEKIDASNSDDLNNKINNIIENGNNLIAINCEKLNYMSSAGLRVLMIAAKKLKVIEGKLLLYNLKENIKKILDLSGFSSFLIILDNINDSFDQTNSK